MHLLVQQCEEILMTLTDGAELQTEIGQWWLMMYEYNAVIVQ